MNKFPWGKVLDKFDYDFDGKTLHIIKYHPWKNSGSTNKYGEVNTDIIEYYCPVLNQYFTDMQEALIAWIAHENLGWNQCALVAGICRSLGVGSEL